jgi:hypothetical protein
MISLFDPKFWLGALLIALALLISGYAVGYQAATNSNAAQQVKTVQKQVVEVAKEDTRREEIGAQREVTREKIRVVYRTIREQAIEQFKPPVAQVAITPASAVSPQVASTRVDIVCGLDADGLRVWNAANAADTTGLPSSPDRVLPSAAASSVRGIKGADVESH